MMKKYIAFELFYNEIDFIKEQILLFHNKYKNVPILFVVQNKDDKLKIIQNYPELSGIANFILRRQCEDSKHLPICLFITTEQWRGLSGVPSYCCFHGQPSKGLTLQPHAAKNFTGFFLLGPLHRQCIEEYYEHFPHLGPCPILYNIGYPKSDAVINGVYKREKVLTELGLPLDRPTVLYAPAFNENASMREQGMAILEELLSLSKWNVLAKLAVDCWQPPENVYANGGINWFEVLKGFEQREHFRLYKKMGVDPLLVAADVLVTCVSSVAFEFLVLGKPVIYIDTPKFFSHYLKMYFPHEETISWAERTTVNAGREFGVLVKNLEDLVPAVEKALRQNASPIMAKEMQQRFLYNPGQATKVFVDHLHELYTEYALSKWAWKSRLPTRAATIAHYYATGGWRRAKRAWTVFWRGAMHSPASYIDCVKTVEAAHRTGLSINDYLESQESAPQKIGRRDRIIAALKARGLLDIKGGHILEIGAGTGRFLEKTIALCPACYEVYEIDKDWSGYLNKTYGKTPGVALRVHEADGSSLNKTANGSCGRVFAHAVFVYTPFTITVAYLREIARVCAFGGKVCFDIFYDSDWSLQTARVWRHQEMNFPVVLSRTLMESIYSELGFACVEEFTEIYGASYSRYIVLEKRETIRM